MKITTNSFSFFILLLVLLVNYTFAVTTFVKYNELSSYEQYGMYSSSGCQIQNFAVVLDDQYEITKFGSNINTPWGGVKKSYYQGTQKLYSLDVLNIPIGTTDEIIFDVTNSNKVTTKIFVPLTQPFQCKKFLLNEYNVTQISDIYLYQGTYYGFNIGLNISNDLTAAYSLTCKLSFTQYCGIFKNVNSYFVYGMNLLLNQLNQETFSFVISDYFGNSKTLSIANNIFSYSELPSVITSMDITPKNNTVFDLHLGSFLKVSLQVTYSELNAFPTVKDEKTGQIIPTLGSLILGTPEEQTYLFTALASGNILSPLQSFTLVEVASPIKNIASFNYSIIDSGNGIPITVPTPSLSLVLNNETGNLLFKINFQMSKLTTDIEIYPSYRTSNFSSGLLPTYPYGISKSNKNSNYDINYEGIFPNSVYGAEYSIKIDTAFTQGNIGNNSDNLNNYFPIPTNIPGIITSDNEGPVLHEISYELLQNGKILITMNITDVGSGVYLIFCIQPYFSLLAKQALISGDINNGIYQFLVNVYDVQTIGIQLYAYDYMGNYGLRNNYFDFYDINFSSVDPVLPYNILPSDITFFEFDRLEVDTSFDDLQVTLRINFKGANSENGSIPYLIPIYGDSRSDILSYFGVFNESTQMFDVKFNVKERERGYFQYLLIIPPLNILQVDIEALFPGQRIKLTTNYVDHFAPIITNFKSLTDVNLTINQGDEIEIGWDVEIYDYPTGLRNAYFEVISDKDFEPYIFNFTPNAVVGDDILSTYTIKFSVKPVVNQTYYISKVQLYDKNGYFSEYPEDTSSLRSFASFYNNTFTSERNIQVGLSSSLVSDNTAPTLLSLSFPTSFDSFGIDRTAVVQFTVQDDISGISTRHNPYVYIQFNFQGFLSAKSQLILSNNSTLTNTYSASFEFGYGDLAYGAIVSIHGITDNSLNVLSYSSSQLASKGFPSTIVNPIQIRPPVILDYTNINENGGKLFIYGKEFTNSPVIYMDKGNGFEIISPSFTSNAALTLIIPSVKGIQSLKFKVVSKQTDSNIITIIPIVNPVSVVSNCTSLNDCNGKGECINSKCVCNTGSSGPDCSSTTNELNVAPTPTTPSFSSFGSMIELNQLNEMDFNGKIVKSYLLTSWEGTTIQSQYQSASAYQYVSELDSTGTTVTVVVDIFNSPATINFAANKLSMDKGTVKYTISFNSYPFASRLNTLQLVVNASIIEPVSNSTCKLNSYSFIENTNSLEWIKLRSNDKSIYGKFIQSGLIDYRSIGIQNKLLVAPTIENQQAIIGIGIPYFFKTAVLDPDFSVLLDTDNLGKNTKSSCYKDENGDGVDSGSTVDDYGVNSSGLSKSKVIIISVICSVAGAAIIIASVILVKKNLIQARFKRSISRNTNAK